MYCMFLMELSGGVPLVAGREKLKCNFWTLGETPASSEQYLSEYHCYSKC